MFFGLIILVVGIAFLLKNIDIISGDVWPIIWPSLVVAVGLSILFRRKKHEKKWEKFGERMSKIGEEIGKTFEGKEK